MLLVCCWCVGWLTGYLAAWLVGCLVAWLVGRSVGLLGRWFAYHWDCGQAKEDIDAVEVKLTRQMIDRKTVASEGSYFTESELLAAGNTAARIQAIKRHCLTTGGTVPATGHITKR